MLRFAFATVLPFFLAARAAVACEYIGADVRRFAEELKEESQGLNAFEAGLRQMVASCREASVELSARAGAGATAQACVALRETADLHRDLAETGEACAQLTDVARQSIEAFRESKTQPFDTRLETLNKLSETDPDISKYCPEPTRVLHRQVIDARALLERSRSVVALAEEEVSKFRRLSDQARAEMSSSREVAERCGSSGGAPLIAGRASVPEGEPSRAGTPPEGASTVTGSLRAKLKLALNEAVVIIGPAEPAYSLAMQPQAPDPAFSADKLVAGAKDAARPPASSAANAIPASISSAASLTGAVGSTSGGGEPGLRLAPGAPAATDVLASFSGTLSKVSGVPLGKATVSGSAVGELLVLASRAGPAQGSAAGATPAVSNTAAAEEEDLFHRVSRRLRNREGELASVPRHKGVVKMEVHAGLDGELVVALSPGE